MGRDPHRPARSRDTSLTAPRCEHARRRRWPRSHVNILLREHRDTASAQAFFRQAMERTRVIPHEVVTDRQEDVADVLEGLTVKHG